MTNAETTTKTDSRSKMYTKALQYPDRQYMSLSGNESDTSEITINHYIIRRPSIADPVKKDAVPLLSLACRQGKIVITECETRPEQLYTYQVVEQTYAHQSAEKRAQAIAIVYKLPHKFMTDRIYPIVSSGSPAIFPDHTLGEAKINNINPPPLTNAEVNSLSLEENLNAQRLTKITGLSVQSNSKDNTAPQKLIKSIASLNVDSIKYTNLNYDGGNVPTMDCKGKGYAEDLYYEAGALEAFACKAKSDTQTPQVVIAACGKDGKMHVAPFITKQFQNAVTSFTAGETYTCHAPDPVWVRYKYYANKQGITEDRMTLSPNIYPEITKVNLPVTACKPDIATTLPLQDCFARTLFDKQTVARLASETKDPTTLQEIVNNPITNIAQVSSAMYATNFMEEDAIQPLNSSSCPNSTEINTTITDTLNTSLLPQMPSSKSSVDSVVVPVISFFVAIGTIAAIVIAICCKFGSEKVISTGRSRLNQCRSQINELRQNNCLTGSEDAESQVEEEDKHNEQNTCTRLAQTCRARLSSGIQNFRKRPYPEMQEVPQSELSSREQDTSCIQNDLSSREQDTSCIQNDLSSPEQDTSYTQNELYSPEQDTSYIQNDLSSHEHCTPTAEIEESISERASRSSQESVYTDC